MSSRRYCMSLVVPSFAIALAARAVAQTEPPEPPAPVTDDTEEAAPDEAVESPAPADPGTKAPANPPDEAAQPEPATSPPPPPPPMDAEAPPSPEPAAQEPVEPVFEPQPAEPPPPPPPVEPEDGFEMPEFSIRVDPFNWLLEGRLGLELEVDTWEFISVELVPEFVANSSPPTFNLGSFPAELKQKSNGLGPVSGAALSVGFWLDGKPLEGTVLRVVFANRGYEYSTENEQGTIDRLTHTDRRVFGFVGSHARWGAFTIAGGIGLGVELNNQQRCIDDLGDASATCSKDVLEIRADNGVPPSILDLNGSLHPAYLMGRFSLGVVL